MQSRRSCARAVNHNRREASCGRITVPRIERRRKKERRGKGRRWRSDCVTRTCRAPVSVITISLRCVSEAASAASIISRHVKRGSIRKAIEPGACFPDASNYNFQVRSRGENSVGEEITRTKYISGELKLSICSILFDRLREGGK